MRRSLLICPAARFPIAAQFDHYGNLALNTEAKERNNRRFAARLSKGKR